MLTVQTALAVENAVQWGYSAIPAALALALILFLAWRLTE